MAMDKEQFEELCAAYVLDALDEPDRQAFEQALAEADKDRRQFYEEMRYTTLHLPLAAEQSAPPAHLKDRILQAVQPERPDEHPASDPADDSVWDRLAAALGLHNPGFAFGVTICLVIIVGVLSFYALNTRSTLQEELVVLRDTVGQQNQQLVVLQDELAQKEALLEVLSAPIIEMVLMSGLEVNPDGYGKIIWDPTQRSAILQLSNLPAAPTDKDYQLWVIRNQVPVSAGVFPLRQSTEEIFIKIDNLVETDKSAINAFAITLEPAGGVPQPTGDMYMAGNSL